MEATIAEIVEAVKQAMVSGMYGSIQLDFQKGELTLFRKLETWRPGSKAGSKRGTTHELVGS